MAGVLAGVLGGPLEPLPLRGVAHDHLRLAGRGLVARVPRWSQAGLDATANLAHQAAAFERASSSGHTPRLVRVVEPRDGLPMGALVVTAVEGRPPRLPHDLPAIARALAALHRLPVPAPPARQPLSSPADPVTAALALIGRQLAFLPQATADHRAHAIVAEELAAARGATLPPDAPATLVGADVHPGNFLIDAAGKAWFVDLERAQYGLPGMDLAHASLPSSTRWDPDVAAAPDRGLSATEVAGFVEAWAAAVPATLAAAVLPWLGPLRRLTWLRTLSWMARWVAEGERLSPGIPGRLATHMRRHAEWVLDPDAMERVRAEWRL